MSDAKRVWLLSRCGLFRYSKFTYLRRKLHRFTHMSSDGSPFVKLSTGRRRRGLDKYLWDYESTKCSDTNEDSSQLKAIIVGQNSPNHQDEGISDDDADCIIYPEVSNVRSETESSALNGLPFIKKAIEGRRPLHQKALNDKVGKISSAKSSVSKSNHPVSPRNKSAPYHSSKGKKSENDDDSVEFVSEIPPKRPSPSTPTKCLPDADEKSSSDCSPSKKTCDRQTKIPNKERLKTAVSTTSDSLKVAPIRKINITLRLNKDLLKSSALNCRKHPNNGDGQNHKTSAAHGNCDVKGTLGSKEELPNMTEDFSEAKLTNGVLEEDDDLVVVQSDERNIDEPTLKRIVISVVSHFVEENDAKNLTLEYVLNRLKALYHKDFSNRTKQIKYFIRRGLERCNSLQMHKEVRPGVRKSDIDTLSSENWLNDIIINQYMSLIVKGNSKFGAISSFWYEELLRGKEPSLPSNWGRLKSILVPTCVDAHWSLLSYSPRTNSVEIYSSLPVSSAEVQCSQILLEFFSKKLNGKVKGNCLAPSGLPRQGNEHDCGVYVCMFARCIVCGNSFSILPEQVYEFRKWLKNEILMGQLLG